jgi:hypothetical protein
MISMNKTIFLAISMIGAAIIVPTFSATNVHAVLSCNPGNGRYYCLGYKHGTAAADRGEANDCPNDDPGNPNNNQYCYGFSQGYKDGANAK